MKRVWIGIAIALFGGLIYVFGWSSLFTVSEVDVVGAPTAESQNLVLSKSGIAVGDHLARIDKRAVQAHLASMRWIEKVDLSRNWISHKVTLSLGTRTPIARLNSFYLAEDGTTFDLPGGTREEIPTVLAATQSAGIAAAHLFTSLPSDFRTSITSMKAGSQSFTFQMLFGERNIQVRWGGDSENQLKIRVLNALLALPENSKIVRVDVSAPHAPIVK